MAYVLALVAVAITCGLAYRRYLHPWDYLVEAGLALELAGFVVIVTPTLGQHALLGSVHAPQWAITRSAFFLHNGVSIELASVIVALGAVGAWAIRNRTFDDGPHIENHG
ncbi:MAG: hypothetical protein R2745_07560 [Vicinamibacterales bacterium]